jgi:hypothetical protein
MNNRMSIVIVCAGALLLSGCAKYYKPKPLGMPHVVGQEKNGLLVQAAPLSSDECKYAFNNCSPRSKGYEVIQLAVTNKTEQVYALDAKNIGLPLASARHVAHLVGFGVAWPIALWTVLGVPSTLCLAMIGLGTSNPGMFKFAWCYGGVVTGLTASGVVHRIRANNDIVRDFEQRAISNDSNILVYPQSIMNRVMFVKKKDYTPSFDIGFVDQSTGEVVMFAVDLK